MFITCIIKCNIKKYNQISITLTQEYLNCPNKEKSFSIIFTLTCILNTNYEQMGLSLDEQTIALVLSRESPN